MQVPIDAMTNRNSPKRGFYFSYDDTPNWEKEPCVNKSEEKIIPEFKICATGGNGSRVVVTLIFKSLSDFFLTIMYIPKYFYISFKSCLYKGIKWGNI